MKKLPTVFKSLAIALVMSGLSFAGVADGASKFLGNTTTRGEIPEDYGTYWNQITAEEECMWFFVEKERGEYDWSSCDLAYNWAKTNNAYFTFRTLLWGSRNPEWLKSLGVDETKKAITDWFDAVQEHYPDLEMIEVVNEAVKNGNSYHSGFDRGAKLIEALGGDSGNYEFVVSAFKMARQRWPQAILIYNDYNTILWQKDQGIDLLKKIKAQGAPVDAYGMQFHETLQVGSGTFCTNSSILKRTLHEAHEQTGLPIYITQYDVAVNKDSLQEACYKEHIPVLMETEYVAGITLWGYIFGKTWIGCTDGEMIEGCSGLIKDDVERSALTWLKEYFKNPGAVRYGHGVADGAEKFLGHVVADARTIPEDFGAYWNQVVADDACTWGSVEKERGKFDFYNCSAVYGWSEANRVEFSYRNLLKGTHLPHWLNGLDADETKKAVEAWFDAVASYYPDLSYIEVVDGALRNSNGFYHSGFESGSKIIEALGGNDDESYSFVANAFNMARKRWPYATLIYSDYSENGWGNDKVVDLIQKLQAQDAAVDAFGIQANNLMVQGTGPATCVSEADVKEGLQEIYEKIRLPLFISEYNIVSDNDSLQKACFAEHIPAFMESEYVAGVTLGDVELAKNGEKRPAMTWLEQYFKEHFYDAKSLWYRTFIPHNPVDTLGQEEPPLVVDFLHLEQNSLQKYDLFDLHGVRLDVFSAYGLDAAVKKLCSSSTVKSTGIYYLRSRSTGKIQSVRIIK